MSFDPTRWRNDTAAALAGRIHLNNAGAALMPQPVVAAVREHLDLEVHLGGYEAAAAASADIEACYDDVGSLVGARRRNIAFVENATVAFAQALSAFDFDRGDVILTTRNDYVSNQLMYLSLARRLGVEVIHADDAAEGGVDLDSLRDLVHRRKPKIVAATWIPTNTGLVQPAAAIGEICAAAEVPYLLDACQAIGQIDVDVAGLHCDFLAATARKFLRGPRGIGFLFVSDRMLEQERAPLFIDMRGADWVDPDRYALDGSARRFENWEFAWSLVLGVGAAARYAQTVGIGAAGQYAAELTAYARDRLAALPGVRVLDHGPELAAILAAEFEGHDAGEIMIRLREQAINTNATYRNYAVLDMDAKAAASALRVSPHYYNTRREIDILANAVEEFTV
jgi:selenocysteine lyase/cysteine desulfurase